MAVPSIVANLPKYCYVCDDTYKASDKIGHEASSNHQQQLKMFNEYFEIIDNEIFCKICQKEVEFLENVHSHAAHHSLSWTKMKFNIPLKGLESNNKPLYCHICQVEHTDEVSKHESSKVHISCLEKFKIFFKIRKDKATCNTCSIAIDDYASAHSHANQHFVTWLDLNTITELMFDNNIGFENKSSDHLFCFACNSVISTQFHNFADGFDHVHNNKFHRIFKGRMDKSSKAKYSKECPSKTVLKNMIKLRYEMMKTLHNHYIGLRGQTYYCYHCDTLGKRQVQDVSIYYLLDHVKQDHRNLKTDAAKVPSVSHNYFMNYRVLVSNSVFMESETTFECKICLCKISGVQNVKRHINGNFHLKMMIAFGNMSLNDLKTTKMNLNKNPNEESWSEKQRLEMLTLLEKWSDFGLKLDEGGKLDATLPEIEKILVDRKLLYKILYKNKIGYCEEQTRCYFCDVTLPAKLSQVVSHVLFDEEHKKNSQKPVGEKMSALENHKECALFASNHVFEEGFSNFRCKLCSETFLEVSSARVHYKSTQHTKKKNSLGKVKK